MDAQSTQATPAPPEIPIDPKTAHEAAEAQRKAEWDAKQAEKKAAFEQALAAAQAMSNEDVIAAAITKLGGDVEPPARRDMKLCVADYVRRFCKIDPNLSRKVMHPSKNMVNCIRAINRQAMEHLRAEAKKNGEGYGNMGGDVPDDLCYKWAVLYFKDPDAVEDKDKDDKFIPKPYNVPKTPKKKPAEQVDFDLGEEPA